MSTVENSYGDAEWLKRYLLPERKNSPNHGPFVRVRSLDEPIGSVVTDWVLLTIHERWLELHSIRICLGKLDTIVSTFFH
ncbi:hypothetical protein CW613_000533 [Vibrio mimicus]